MAQAKIIRNRKDTVYIQGLESSSELLPLMELITEHFCSHCDYVGGFIYISVCWLGSCQTFPLMEGFLAREDNFVTSPHPPAAGENAVPGEDTGPQETA